MKKFLIISALSILLPSSITAGKKLDATHVGIGVAVVLVAGGGFYYYQTRYNTPFNNPSLTPKDPQQQKEHNQEINEQLNNQQPSNTEKPSENNKTQKKPSFQKTRLDNNNIIPSKPTSEPKSPSSNNNKPMTLQPTTDTHTQQQISFSEALCQRFHQPETEKHLEKLLTDHAFCD